MKKISTTHWIRLSLILGILFYSNLINAQAEAGDNQTICSNFATLDASPPAGYWTVVSGNGNFADPTNAQTLVTDLAPGDNVFRWTSPGQSPESDDVTITNNLIIANPGPDGESCDNTYNLAANNPTPGNGTWTIVYGSGKIEDSRNNVTTVRELSTPTVKLEWKIENQGCIDKDTVTITNNTITTDAGDDSNTCGSTAYLYAMTMGDNGIWSTVGTTTAFIIDPSSYSTEVKNLQSGANSFEWRQTKGSCFDADTVTIYNDSIPANAGADGESCDNTFSLNADDPAPGIGFWTIVSGSGTITNESIQNTTVTELEEGIIEIEWKINNNECFSADTITIINNTVFADAGENESICDSIYTLAANKPSIGALGQWSPISFGVLIEDPTNNNTIAENLRLGENLFLWTVSKGTCLAKDTAIITNNLEIAFAGDSIGSCTPDNIQLFANIPTQGIGEWSDVGANAVFSEKSINNAWVSNLAPGINQLVWTITNGGCIDKDTLIVSVSELIASIETGDIADVCDSFMTIEANTLEPGTWGDWLPLESPVYFDDHTATNTIVRGLTPGRNRMIWQVSDGICTDKDTLVINYLDPSQAGISGDANLFFENTTGIDTVINIYAYGTEGSTYGYWTVLQGNATITENSTIGEVHITDTTNNIIMGTMGNDACELTDTILITIGLSFIPGDTVNYLDWTNPEDWANGMVPGQDDSVTIFGTQAFIDGDTATCNSIYISSGSSFNIRGGGVLFANVLDLSQNNKRFKTDGDANLTVEEDGVLKIGYGETDQKGLRISTGGVLTVENNPNKATGDGGALYVRGGSVIIEQDAEKATGDGGTMYIRGSVIIEQDAEKSTNLKATSTGTSNDLIIRSGGSVIIEQDAEKSTSSGGLLQVRGGSVIIEQDAEKSTYAGGTLRVRSGSVIIEQDAEKSTETNNGKLYVRGGSVIIEQDAEKTTYKTEIIAPETEIYNGQILIGALSNTKITGSGFRTGSIIIEQDAEKSTDVDTSLIIKTGGSLLIDNNLNPAADYSISIGSNAYVTFEEGSIIDLDAAATGTIKPIILKEGASLLDMNTTDLFPAKFEHSFAQNVQELFSSPFASINSADFTTDATIKTWNEADNTWSSLNTNTDFTALEGFNILYPAIDYNSTIGGTLNTGTISKSLDFSSKSVAGEAGWNLTGNPYPCAIVWDSINTDNISAAVYTYNTQTKQYNVYMKGGVSLNGATPYIKAGEAFFVRANDVNASLKFTNIAKQHYDFTDLKTTNDDYLKLTVEGNSYSDEAVIRFISDATNDYDSDYDAYKLLAEDDAVPQIYSILESDNSKMAINSLIPPGNTAVTVPLNFEVSAEGDYKISATELNFPTDVSVILKDLKNNITQDLRTNPDYSFTYTSGDPVERFEIQFGAGITSIDTPEKQELNVDIYSYSGNIYIKTFDDNDYRYEIYDTQGKLLKSDKLYNKGLNNIPFNEAKGIYIVKVLSDKQTYTKQIPIIE